METTLTIARKILGSMLNPVQSETKHVRTFKGIKNHVKCNAYLPAPKKHPVVRFRKGNYRRICQSSAPLGTVCVPPKLCPDYHQLKDECPLNGCFFTPLRNPYIGTIRISPFVQNWRWYTNMDSKAPCDNVRSLKNSDHMGNILPPTQPQVANNWRWYTTTDEDNTPSRKGGPVKESGGRLGKLDAVNEKGFFHKINKSKLEQIKELLKNKSMQRDADNTGKKSE